MPDGCLKNPAIVSLTTRQKLPHGCSPKLSILGQKAQSVIPNDQIVKKEVKYLKADVRSSVSVSSKYSILQKIANKWVVIRNKLCTIKVFNQNIYGGECVSSTAICDNVSTSSFLTDVLRGLSQTEKTLPSKYFYDEAGSRLFENICELDEYYPTRTELSIMQRHAQEMSDAIGPDHVVLELGSGSSLKTQLLLKAMQRPAAYVPFDISQSALNEAVARLEQDFPSLNIAPVCGDFMSEIQLPSKLAEYRGVVTYFPGSTIGNLNHKNAVALLERIRRVNAESDLLIGIDLEKDRQILLDAYNDSEGVTAAFNLNLIKRINNELNADFDLNQFQHRAIYNEQAHRIEMQLVSQVQQRVTIGGQVIEFEANETICTEHSHKYTIERFEELAAEAGFKVANSWVDEKDWFAILLLTPADATS